MLATHLPEAHLTEWLYVSPDIVVAVDLDKKEFDLRLLAVPNEHVSCNRVSDGVVLYTQNIAMGVARALCRERGYKLVEIDTNRHSIQNHWHLQVCLRKVEDK